MQPYNKICSSCDEVLVFCVSVGKNHFLILPSLVFVFDHNLAVLDSSRRFPTCLVLFSVVVEQPTR